MTRFGANTERIRLLGGYDDRFTLWEDETTADERDPHPGVVVADDDNEGSLVFRARGSYEGDPDDIRLHVRDGGFPNQRGTFLWSEDGVTKYGWDAPTRVGDVGHVEWTTLATPRNGLFDLVEAGDGTLVCVTDYAVSNNGTQVRVHARSASSGAASWTTLSGTVVSVSTTDPTNYPAGFGAHPALVNIDGAVYMFLQRHLPQGYYGSTNKATQVDVYRAGVDADWTGTQPFELYATDVLDSAYSYSAGAPGHMSAAKVATQVVLLMAGAGTDIVQYASADNAASLTQVGTLSSTNNESFSVVKAGRFFVLAMFNSDDELVVRVVGDATAPFSEVAESTVSTDVNLVSGVAPVLMVEPAGRVWLYAQLGNDIVAWTSDDRGRTWKPQAGGVDPIRVIEGKDATDNMAVAWWRGRGVLLHTTENCTGYAQSLACVDLGGWSNHTLPVERELPGERLGWTTVWTAREDPQTIADGFTYSETGSPTTGWDADGYWNMQTGASETCQWQPSGSLSYTANMRAWSAQLDPNSGQADLFLRTSNYGLQVTITAAGIQVIDANAGSLVSIPRTGPIVVFAAVEEASGKGVVMYRDAGSNDAQAWVQAYNSTLTSGALTGMAIFTVQQNSDIGAKMQACALPGPSYAMGPSEPYGRRLSSLAQWVTNGVSFEAVRGPGVAGDSFICSSASMYGLERAAFSPSFPSPRRGQRFESATATSGDAIAYRQNSTGNTTRAWPLWLFYFEGNVETIRVDWYVSGSWQTGPTVRDSQAVDLLVEGLHVVPDSTTTTPDHVDEDELVGGYVNPGGTIVPIEANTSGCLQAPTGGSGLKWKQTRVRIEDGHNSASCDKLWYPRSVAVLDSSDVPAAFTGYRIVLLGDVPPEGRWHVKFALVPAYPLIQSHGRDTRRTYRPMRDETRGEAGLRTARQSAPMENEIVLSWQQTLDIHSYQTWRDGEAPDYWSDANDEPAFARGELGALMRALFERWYAVNAPVIYVPKAEVDNLPQVFYRNRAGGALVATLEGTWSIDDAGGGDEQHDIVTRNGMVTLQRLT